MTGTPRNVWDLHAELGEGPVWAHEALWFVDIKKREVHRYDTRGGGRRSWPAPEQVGFIVPAQGGGFVAGLESGLYRFDPESGDFTLIAEVEPELTTNRLNDGAVDPAGRLWFGTMDDREKAPTGAFYCFDGGTLIRTAIEGITITNGPTISPDGHTLYHVDTKAGAIGAADIRDDGTLGPSRPFVRIEPAAGSPDGPTMDSEGCLWIGLYDGWAARRYSPGGELVETVRFPVANITKLAFGGEGLRTLYATTARQLLSPQDIAKQPEAGDLFELRVDVTGLSCPAVRL